MLYQDIGGFMIEMDTFDCSEFGFEAGDKVKNPKNISGVVVGVAKNPSKTADVLWCRFDDDKGKISFVTKSECQQGYLRKSG